MWGAAMKWLKKLGVLITALAMVAVVSTAAAAQSYGDNLPVIAEIASGTADDDGQFRYSYTAPDEIDEDFLVYVVGTDEDGLPFEWVVAAVTPAFAGLTWTLAGANMEPGSNFVLETRLAGAPSGGTDDADDTTDDSDDDAAETGDSSDDSDDGNSSDDDADDDESAGAIDGDDDGDDIRGFVGIALVLLLIGVALAYGLRLARRA